MDPRRTLTLVCNSHIDPVWLWPWEEGVAVTLATFRSAAALCEEFDGFVFCHNEALLYMWLEEHEPALFARIRDLVARGRWHIMGGWFLQPDCNLPTGESLVRQILVGRAYFRDRFGVEPRVAVNLDPFGHARGLVQILAKSGYEGYLFCRPDANWLPLPGRDFDWVGLDGSTVVAHRADEHYNSTLGEAGAKIERWLAGHEADDNGLLLWGVGNHGGGPSRRDLRDIADLAALVPSGRSIAHGSPEAYLDRIKALAAPLPRVERDLNPWAVGCYTSMATVKQAHLQLERSLFAAEAVMANLALQSRLPYPAADLHAALEDLLFCQFHDVLPGEGVREVELQALGRLAHGQAVVSRLRARAFFAMLDGEPPASEGEYPLFVHNHHPFAVSTTVCCEFQAPEPNANPAVFWQPVVADAEGREVPAQLEKESCNIQNDHRKRVVFAASLAAASNSRFSCRLVEIDRQSRTDASQAGLLALPEGIRLSLDTGLVERLDFDGGPCLLPGAGRLLLLDDSADPWGMKVRGFRSHPVEFALMSPAEAGQFAGVSRDLAPVRVIESGPVRTVVEALFRCHRSAAAVRYKVPVSGSEIEMEVRVAWFERDRLLKLSIPTPFAGAEVLRQTAYGTERVDREREELCGHRWLAVVPADRRCALTVVSDRTYGFDFDEGELRVSLVRSPAYAGHPVDDVTPIVRQDRFEPREDQGEHVFRFWLKAGPAAERLESIDREAAVRTEDLLALNAFPSGDGSRLVPGVEIVGGVVRLGALKYSEDGKALVVRLFEPTGQRRSATVSIPPLALSFVVDLRPFELRTVLVDLETREVADADLLERPLERRP
jgi:alpha-mannosidase